MAVCSNCIGEGARRSPEVLSLMFVGSWQLIVSSARKQQCPSSRKPWRSFWQQQGIKWMQLPLPGASQHTAAGETMPGTTSKAASVAVSAPASAASHLEAPVSWNSSGSSEPKLQTAGTAATEQPGDRARVKAETARRYAYSELDQMARKTLAEIDWSWTSSHEECKDIQQESREKGAQRACC